MSVEQHEVLTKAEQRKKFDSNSKPSVLREVQQPYEGSQTYDDPVTKRSEENVMGELSDQKDIQDLDIGEPIEIADADLPKFEEIEPSDLRQIDGKRASRIDMEDIKLLSRFLGILLFALLSIKLLDLLVSKLAL